MMQCKSLLGNKNSNHLFVRFLDSQAKRIDYHLEYQLAQNQSNKMDECRDTYHI